MKEKLNHIGMELLHHLPFSVFGVLSAVIFMAVLSFLAIIARAENILPEAASELFHVFHPTHVLLSAVATTAMFYKHDERSVVKAVLVGFFGSVVFCGISDVFMPIFGGLILGYDMHMHICLIEHPVIIFPFAALGVFAGLFVKKAIEHSTEFSHSMHVFLSASSSLIYLISFGVVDWMHAITGVFFVTLVAVLLPCCLSDIVFPLLCTHKHCEDDCEHA